MTRKIIFAVLVAALGYFVDIYDLVLFSVVRVASLKGIGVADADITNTGVLLLNAQMAGLLIGGLIWGVVGDRRGRLSILFGSILLYSLANIGNAFVTSVPQYALFRFLAGVGLAGELGAGVTLVSEIMPKDKRGIGTAIVAAVGVAGATVASLVADMFAWKTAYVVGGAMGLSLFVLRLAVAESAMFKRQNRKARRGDLKMLFLHGPRLRRYISCVIVGVPLWFMVGLVMTFAPEIGRALKLSGEVRASGTIFWFYSGLVGGDLASGLFSQLVKSRRKALLVFTLASLAGTVAILNLPASAGPRAFYWLSGATGFFAGYWALFVTVAAESFGTNLRATVATSVPNMVRGATILLTSAFGALKGSMGVIGSLETLAAAVFAAALTALYFLKETFGRDLDFIEE
jgi:putative MFS transporter